jgi:hypothetical protein
VKRRAGGKGARIWPSEIALWYVAVPGARALEKNSLAAENEFPGIRSLGKRLRDSDSEGITILSRESCMLQRREYELAASHMIAESQTWTRAEVDAQISPRFVIIFEVLVIDRKPVPSFLH